MAIKRKIDPKQGKDALIAVLQTGYLTPDQDLSAEASPVAKPARQLLATAVRFSLEDFADLNPGGAVEIRVPPYGVAQAITGVKHTRGTPPAVVETDAKTWLQLVTGKINWDSAVKSGQVEASGERSNLSEYLPHLKRLEGMAK